MNANSEVILSILAYSLCSGSLVLLNKLILHHLPYPSLVIVVQLIFALSFILGANKAGLLPIDPVRWIYLKPYSIYIIAFAMGVYCNMKSLSMSNVETVIVFRALSPCLVAFLDAIFLGREYPSSRSWLALGLIVLGAYGYASFDEKFLTQGMAAYTWPFLYLCIISFEMAYGKRIIRSVDLKTLSGPVMYTNMLGILPMLIFAAMGNEYSQFFYDRVIEQQKIGFNAVFLLLLGCITGTGIGYSSWWCRDKVSATSFTLIGVMNKCLTVLLNLIIWDQHAAPGGIMSLVLCLVGGSLYVQAPMRGEARKEVAKQADIVWESDISLDGKEESDQFLEEQQPELEGISRRRM